LQINHSITHQMKRLALVTQILVTVSLMQCRLHYALAAQADGGGDGPRSETRNTPGSRMAACLRALCCFLGKCCSSRCASPLVLRLPYSVTAIILGMCYYAKDAELASLMAGSVEIGRAVNAHPTAFVTDMKWSRFHESDKGRYINLTEDGRTAANDADETEYSVVRARRWSLPSGQASATVRVDSITEHGFLSIGVISDRFTEWDHDMWPSPWAWHYDADGQIWHNAVTVREDVPRLVTGSVVRVTLGARRVRLLLKVPCEMCAGTGLPTGWETAETPGGRPYYYLEIEPWTAQWERPGGSCEACDRSGAEWVEQYAFTLPLHPGQCGNISLGVTQGYGTKVTILP